MQCIIGFKEAPNIFLVIKVLKVGIYKYNLRVCMVNSDSVENKVLSCLDQAHFAIISLSEIVLHAGTGCCKLLDNVPFTHEL